MSRTLDSETLIKPAKFAHFVLRVRNLEKSIAWYQTVLGMEMVHRAEKIAFMTYDDEHLRLADGPDEVHWFVVGRAELARWVEEGASAYDPKASYQSRPKMDKVFSGP
jgi:catechol 2,3-dioxygenase-like lactoylglutathione lyase family enzyme